MLWRFMVADVADLRMLDALEAPREADVPEMS